MNTLVLLVCMIAAFSAKATNSADQETTWPCNKHAAIQAFKRKVLVNAFPTLLPNPYSNQTRASSAHVNAVNANHSIVCGIRYTTTDRIHYELRTFASQLLAVQHGFIVTHQGRCGVCSNLNDLAVYLERNLTAPARDCALESEFSDTWTRHCFEHRIGFTENCARVWTDNAINTRQHCFWVCLKAWLHHDPYNKPDGSLNACLQCDEDKSGPVFKYFSGRTRRNSGIHSAIHRPPSQIYNMTHCYY